MVEANALTKRANAIDMKSSIGAANSVRAAFKMNLERRTGSWATR